MYMHLGDAEGLDSIRNTRQGEHHCVWLRRDPNACESLPDGIDGIEAGTVCPHNVYVHKAEVFANRDSVGPTIERVFRLIGAADLRLLSESDLTPLAVTELLAARSELNRQENLRTKRMHEQARMESQVNRSKESFLPEAQS